MLLSLTIRCGHTASSKHYITYGPLLQTVKNYITTNTIEKPNCQQNCFIVLTTSFILQIHKLSCIHAFLTRCLAEHVFFLQNFSVQYIQIFCIVMYQSNTLLLTSKISSINVDIKIIENRKFQFDVSRKNTYSDAVIRSDSFHPVTYKVAAINSVCYRTVKCLT